MDQTRNKNGGPLVSYMKKLEVYLYYFFISSRTFYVVYRLFIQVPGRMDVCSCIHVKVIVHLLPYLQGKCFVFFGNKNLNFIYQVVLPFKVLGNIAHFVFDDLFVSLITRNQEDYLAHFGSVTPFCHPKKTPENLRFSDVFGGYKWEH